MENWFQMNMPESEINAHSSLSLAYLGDAVFELMVRSWLMQRQAARSGELHKTAVNYVKAPAQAEYAKKLLPILTEEELGVYKRGRNCHVNSVPHGANKGDYHAATGLEMLFGYLYLKGQTARLGELFAVLTEEEECR